MLGEYFVLTNTAAVIVAVVSAGELVHVLPGHYLNADAQRRRQRAAACKEKREAALSSVLDVVGFVFDNLAFDRQLLQPRQRQRQGAKGIDARQP